MSALSATARKEYYLEIASALPAPVIDKLEYRERRLTAAVEAFDALRPGDAYEGRLAVRIVLCGAHAVECLREAGVYREDFPKMTRCRAQAAGMTRAECSAKRTLEREQKMRLAGEAVANGAGAQPEGAAVPPSHDEPQAPLPVRAVAAAPLPVIASAAKQSPASDVRSLAGDCSAVPAMTVASPPPSVQTAATPPRAAVTRATPGQVPPGSSSAPSPEAIARAEDFAIIAGVAAAQIRRDGGVTPQSKAYFHRVTLPTDPAVIDALVRGTSAALAMLDGVGGGMLEAAD